MYIIKRVYKYSYSNNVVRDHDICPEPAQIQIIHPKEYFSTQIIFLKVLSTKQEDKLRVQRPIQELKLPK